MLNKYLGAVHGGGDRVTEEKKAYRSMAWYDRLCYVDLGPHAHEQNHTVEIRNCPEIHSGSLESASCSSHDSVQ